MRDDTYVEYRDAKPANKGQAKMSSSKAQRGPEPREAVKNSRKEEGDPGSVLIQEEKHFSNNQEYRMLVEVYILFNYYLQYQQLVSQTLEFIFEEFSKEVQDPRFNSMHKNLFSLTSHMQAAVAGSVASAQCETHIKDIADLKKQNGELKQKMKKQEDLISSLRKQYLKELINLREAGAQGADKFKDSLSVTFFDVTEGIDSSTVEILNMRLSDLTRQFNVQIEEKTSTIKFMGDLIAKYKKLTPKSKPAPSHCF